MIIRPVRDADVAAVQAIYAPYVDSTPISFETIPPSIDEMRQRIVSTTVHYPWLVCEQDGRLVGYAYACQHRTRAAYRWSVDVAVYVDHGQIGKGLGRALYSVLLQQLADLGYANAFAGITLPNRASVALHEGMGFIPIGVYQKVGFKLGQWHDVGWWQRSFQHPVAPKEPAGLST